MITHGFHTLAMLTWGLGIRMPWIYPPQRIPRPKVEFLDKPLGIAVEFKTGPTTFQDSVLSFKSSEIEFEDE